MTVSSLRLALPLAALALTAPLHAQTRERPIRIEVDASDITRHIVHARLAIPAAPGPLTLFYPKWIPGNHRPNGPIENLTGIVMTRGGRPVDWQRDTLDYYTFHCVVPPGAEPLVVRLDYVEAHGSHAVGMLNWNQVVLYPAGAPVSDLVFAPRVTVPRGWESATALEPAGRQGPTTDYRPVDLMTLVDSPVLMGAHTRFIPLSAREELDLAGDSEEALALEPGTIAAFEKLVREGRALFGAAHYRHYRFLTGLSDHIPGSGLEHHECTDIRGDERLLVDRDQLLSGRNVFPHEYVHSWNGKYRRPRGLVFRDFQHPEGGELLWVYEGLTQYLGMVLDGRSGLLSPENARTQFALTASGMEGNTGRAWKNLHDTAVGSGPLRGAPRGWSSWRRGQDYYGEGALVWLEADATIRRLSHGQRSLDDFCRRFHGGADGGPEVGPYDLGDVIAALGAVQPYDWKGFLQERVYGLSTPTPTRALEAAGWKLIMADSVSKLEAAGQTVNKFHNLRGSLGVRLENDGVLSDVAPGSPASRAGLGPGMKVLGVDGRTYTWDRLSDALKKSKKSTRPLELLVEDGEYYRVAWIDDHGGPKYAALERLKDRPDYLTEILSPKTPATEAGSGGAPGHP